MGLNDYIKNVGLLSGVPDAKKTNRPSRIKGQQNTYYGDTTTSFIKKYAQYASDFFLAKVQGLEPHEPERWQMEYIRFSDISSFGPNAAKKSDDVKAILFANDRIEYVPPGTKIEVAGSTWLVTDPQNLSGAGMAAIAHKCNAVWKRRDYYGNIIEEPIVVDNTLARAPTPDPQEYIRINKGYFNVMCQYNENTAQLRTNSRMILGSGAYSVMGYADFLQEFTGDYDTVRLLEFSVIYEEPNFEIDDMENHIAGGKNFSWEMQIRGKSVLTAGEETSFEVISIRNGQIVEGTYEHPIYYAWQTSDESVATVDHQGNLTAVGEGECYLGVMLEQNEENWVDMLITVEGATGGKKIAFLNTPTEKLQAFQTAVLQVQVYENGAIADEELVWNFEGADTDAYSVTLLDGQTVEIKCWGGSVVPLTVTVGNEEQKISAVIALEGI